MTTCAPTDRLMQTLRVNLPGAPDAMIELELFNTMDRFFRRTSAWRFEDQVDINTTDTDYVFSIPEGTVVVRELSMLLNNLPVPPTTSVVTVTASSLGRVSADQTFPDGDAEYGPFKTDLSANIFSYSVFKPNFVTLSKPADVDQAQYPLVATLALSLEKACLECDSSTWPLEDWMFDAFFDDFLEGVYASMFAQVGKPWANAQAALLHGKRFRNQMAFRKQEAVRGFAYDVPAWSFPRGGWVG
jgi:hypothetical protein